MNKLKQPIKINIAIHPEEIEVLNIEIIKKECLKNSYNVCNKYPMTKIVEGIIKIRYPDNKGAIFEHAWNILNDIYFDLTSEVHWGNDKKYTNAIVEYYYFQVYSILDLTSNNLRFSNETINFVKECDKALNQKLRFSK